MLTMKYHCERAHQSYRPGPGEFDFDNPDAPSVEIVVAPPAPKVPQDRSRGRANPESQAAYRRVLIHLNDGHRQCLRYWADYGPATLSRMELGIPMKRTTVTARRHELVFEEFAAKVGTEKNAGGSAEGVYAITEAGRAHLAIMDAEAAARRAAERGDS